MNFFNFFKKTNPPTTPTPSAEDSLNIISSLHDQIELLEKRKDVIKTKVGELIVEAKHKLNSGDKKGALLILNQKKKQEAEADKITSSQLLLENQLFALEGATINREVLTTLKSGNDAIKHINQGITPDIIDELMDDIQETQYTAQQIQQLLNTPLQEIYDDADLLAELDDLEQPLILPVAPKTNPTVVGKVVVNAEAAVNAVAEDEIMLDLRRLEESVLVRS